MWIGFVMEKMTAGTTVMNRIVIIVQVRQEGHLVIDIAWEQTCWDPFTVLVLLFVMKCFYNFVKQCIDFLPLSCCIYEFVCSFAYLCIVFYIEVIVLWRVCGSYPVIVSFSVLCSNLCTTAVFCRPVPVYHWPMYHEVMAVWQRQRLWWCSWGWTKLWWEELQYVFFVISALEYYKYRGSVSHITNHVSSRKVCLEWHALQTVLRSAVCPSLVALHYTFIIIILFFCHDEIIFLCMK